jgi:hypothetical protein
MADNCSSEYPTKTAGHGRELYEWACRPNRDNHLYDAMILSAVAGSILGVKVPGESERVVHRRRISMAGRSASTATEETRSQSTTPSLIDAQLTATAVASGTKRMTLSEMRAARRK